MGNDKTLPVKISDFRDDNTKKKQLDMLFCGLGLIFAFVLYGVLQERIMTIPYGEDQVMFTSTTFIILSNRIVAVLGAAALLLLQNESIRPYAPISKFAVVALLNTSSTICQWESLKYVSFPTQTLGKCGKTIPVLILGTLFAGKKYTAKDYFSCIGITLGCTVFILTGDINVHVDEKSDSIYGIFLICCYLLLDGSTSLLQERIFQSHKNMPVHNQMLYVNLCSGIIVFTTLIFNRELLPSIQFSIDNPSFLIGSTTLSFAAMFGQMMLYYTIQKFGALFYATAMTTRQVFSITLSCIIYFHPLSIYQIFGACVVFTSVYLKTYLKDTKPKSSGDVIKV